MCVNIKYFAKYMTLCCRVHACIATHTLCRKYSAIANTDAENRISLTITSYLHSPYIYTYMLAAVWQLFKVYTIIPTSQPHGLTGRITIYSHTHTCKPKTNPTLTRRNAGIAAPHIEEIDSIQQALCCEVNSNRTSQTYICHLVGKQVRRVR